MRRIFNLVRRRRAVGVTPRSLYRRGENPDAHLVGGWVNDRSGPDTVDRRTISACLGHVAHSLVTLPTELSPSIWWCLLSILHAFVLNHCVQRLLYEFRVILTSNL
jgi:hypothetical protein